MSEGRTNEQNGGIASNDTWQLNVSGLVTEYKYIRFGERGGMNGKTIWACSNKHHGEDLGWVEWYEPWKQYTFTQANAGIVFSASCLRDIASFLEQVNKVAK